MPKTHQDLTEILQVRISKEGRAAIERAADQEHTSVAEFARRALYSASRYTKTRR